MTNNELTSRIGEVLSDLELATGPDVELHVDQVTDVEYRIRKVFSEAYMTAGDTPRPPRAELLLTTFQELLDRAARERWPFSRVVDRLKSLPEPERTKAVDMTIAAIAAELDRLLPRRRVV